MDDRMSIAMTVVAALAKPDDKPCRKKSNVLEAIQYADSMLYWLKEKPSAGVYRDNISLKGGEEVTRNRYPVGVREVGASSGVLGTEVQQPSEPVGAGLHLQR